MIKLIKTLNAISRRNPNYIPKTLLYYKTEGNSLMKRYNQLNLIAKSKYSSEYSSSYNRLKSTELAKQFISTLDNEERTVIKEQILEYEKLSPTNTGLVDRPTWKQLSLVCLQCGLPFIGFGFVDNFIMIIAGDLIESWIGTMIPISTMAAAGLGNAFSDVAGIGLAHHIEGFAMKFVHIPKLTPEQWNLRIVNWLTAFSKSICIFVGCLIGMTPLFFMNTVHDNHTKKNKNDD